MTDDIRDVSQTTPYTPLKGVTRSGAQERQSDQEKGAGGEGRYAEDDLPREEDQTAPARLAAQVEAANARLAASGIKVRLRLAAAPHTGSVEVLLVDATGNQVVSRRMPGGEIPVWIAHIETSEGLLLDDTL